MDPVLAYLSLFLLLIIILLILAGILHKFFPNNKISNKLEEIAEWIGNNWRF